MIELMQKISRATERSTYKPRIAYLLQRMHLHVATDQESEELDEWIHASEINDQLFDLFLDYFLSSSFEEIKSLLANLLLCCAARAKPTAFLWLAQRFFL